MAAQHYNFGLAAVVAVVLAMLAPGTCAQDENTHPETVREIRAMVGRLEFADAAEALAGLPEPVRTREELYLRFRAYDLAQAYDAGMKAASNNRNDTEVFRILGDIDAMERRFDRAAQQYEAAKKALARDPALDDAGRRAEAAALKERDQYLLRERAYESSVRESLRNIQSLSGICFVGIGIAGLSCFAFALRRPRGRRA